MYIYPKNLKAKPTMWLWALKDVSIIVISGLFSVVALFKAGVFLLLLLTLVYAFLTIRFGDFTLLDFLKQGTAYCVTGQQKFLWRCSHESNGFDKKKR